MDQHGILWIGTPQGLNAFDGKYFKKYNTTMGLAFNEVNTLFIDEEQKLWIGGIKGISVLDNTKKVEPLELPDI